MLIQSYFESKGGLLDPKDSCLPMQAIDLANKPVEKGTMDKALQKHGQLHVLCIHGSLGCSKLFRTLPYC